MDNYLIYVGSGGLCHCLSGLSKAIKLSIENNRILVIDTFKLKSFENKLCFFFDLNIDNLIIKYDYHDIYERKVLNMNVSDFKNIYPKLIGNYYYINKHNVTNTDLINYNDSIVVYCGYGGNYINPNIKVNSFFKQFVKKNLKDYESYKNYISIQFRNTDKKNDHENVVNKIKQHIKEFNFEVSHEGTDPDKRDYFVSNKKIESLGWKPKVNLDDGIKELTQVYKLISKKDFDQNY